jgi:hypothetical protein
VQNYAGKLHYLQSNSFTVSFLETLDGTGATRRTMLLKALPTPTNPSEEAAAATQYFSGICRLPNFADIVVTGQTVPYGGGGAIAIVFTTCNPCNG